MFAGTSSNLKVRAPSTEAARAIRGELAEVLRSRGFAGSERLSRFLQFVVEHAIQEPGERIKEYTIGTEVFDRDESFDPRIDPIVRVEVRRLREKLRKYYETEGRNNGMRVELPPRRYLPEFHSHHRVASSADADTTGFSIAVLPVASLSPGQRNEHFCEGLTEEVVHALTRITGLRVVAWGTVLRVRDSVRNIQEIGTRFGVAAVLTGSVRREGDRIRVTAQLLQVSDEACLWSEIYARDLRDVFAVQEEIARAIAEAMRTRVMQPAGAE